MRTPSGRALVFLFVVLVYMIPTAARAQDRADAALGQSAARSAQGEETARVRSFAARPLPTEEHRFLDQRNIVLFSGVVAVRVLDYASTRHFRARGANEILLSNSIVDNKPLFAGIEAAATAASIGISYWLHRTGHHKAERWVSIVHIGVAGFGDARNYTLGRPGAGP